MQAAINGHLNSVLLLLHHGARVDIKNGWGATVLVLASKGGSFGVVHTLINHGANVDQGGTEKVETLTPLMAAAQSGHLEIVRELLQAGAIIDVRLGSTGWTALMLAALNNQVSILMGRWGVKSVSLSPSPLPPSPVGVCGGAFAKAWRQGR